MKTHGMGSMTNILMANTRSLVPTVGMGATLCMYSDSHACTVIEILHTKAGKLKGVVLQRDKAERTDKNGMSESQQYKFHADPNGEKYTATLRKDGRYRIQNGGTLGGTIVLVGDRREYYDYSF